MMVGAPAVENKGELRLGMPNGFLEDVEPPPQSLADVVRGGCNGQYRLAKVAGADGDAAAV